jgi:hypothetical protein
MTTSLVRWTSALVLTGLAWLTLMALIMRFSDTAPLAVVLLPGDALLAQLPPEMAVVSRSAVSITLRSDAPDIAARLYDAGAMLVLPAGLEGCLDLSPS